MAKLRFKKYKFFFSPGWLAQHILYYRGQLHVTDIRFLYSQRKTPDIRDNVNINVSKISLSNK